MAQPYVGEIRLFAGNFAPAGWQFCDGSLLPISEYETLFNLIGTTYGGDGQNSFQMPDMRGRLPVHFGQGPGLSTYTLAQTGGVEQVTLTIPQIPQHSHQVLADNNPANASSGVPTNNIYASQNTLQLYSVPGAPGNDPPSLVGMNNTMLTPVGGSQPHSNIQPFLCINFIISLFGIFPSAT